MTCAVVEVGPATIRGSGDVPEGLVSIALECIDDDITLLDEQPVAVTAVWREVFRAVLPGGVSDAVLVCPTWWPSPRIDRIREAATARCVNTVVLQRAQVLTDDMPGEPSVVEIAADFVTVSRDGCVIAAEPRVAGNADIATGVAAGIGSSAVVLVDVPVGVAGGIELAREISERLRGVGVAVTTVHPDRVLAARSHPPTPRPLGRGSSTPVSPKAMALTAVAAVTLLCVGVGANWSTNGSVDSDMPMTLLIEGRVAVKVPALWAVRRITSGSGSARVQVTAPDDSAAVLITQTRVRAAETLTETAASLRTAVDGEQVDVFTAFNPNDRRAGRPAVTYRESRGGRQVDWAVFVDDGVRIGVGCQSAPGDEHIARYACEQAVQSAHAAF